MRHRVTSKHFNRDVNERKALLRSLVRSLVVDGKITTTVPKAKETKRIADKLIHRAQTDTVANRRLLHRFFGKRDVVNTLMERIAPSMKERTSGFSRMVVSAPRRGDNAVLATLSLVKMPEITGTLKSGKTVEKAVKPVKAAKVEKVVKAKVEKTEKKAAPAKKAVAKTSKAKAKAA